MMHLALVTIPARRALVRGAFVISALLVPNARANAQTAAPHASTARVWEGTLTLPTYDEGMPDVNAPFDVFSAPGRPNYPYTIRDQLTDHRVTRAWRALFLENEYLKCSVLPDLGGHLYSCTDKVNGQEMFYANSSIKYSNIAYRGSWAAFGIEFNFPVSHNWMTTSPVDYVIGQDPDGAAWVEVGNIDRPYGMEWSVRLTVRPGVDVLQQQTTLYNRDLVRHRFYWWTNAGVRAFDDSRIEYPMRYTASHGFVDVDRWPVDSKGTDNSVLKNHVYGPVSRFAHGSREGFMGVWHPRTNAGVAHYASPDELPAKKIWSWGVDSDALDWRRQLSDDSSAYVEIQAGLFRDQETYGWLEPQAATRFTEHWLPLRELGGLTRATPDAALHLTRSEKGARDSVTLRLQVMRRWTEGRLLVHAGIDTIVSSALALDPKTVIARSVRAAAPVSVELLGRAAGDAVWRVLIAHREGEFDFTPDSLIHFGQQPRPTSPPVAQRSDGDWLTIGTTQEVNGDLLGALNSYQSGLARFPTSHVLLRSAGRLAVSLGRYALGDSLVSRALANESADHEMAYYRGVAQLALGSEREALLAFEFASQYGAWREAALWQRASLAARRGERDRAIAILRAGGAAGEQSERLRSALSLLDSTTPIKESHALSPVERFLASGRTIDPPMALHLADDASRILVLADELIAFGQFDAAVTLLSKRYADSEWPRRELGKVSPHLDPIVAFVRGYARAKAGGDPTEDYRAASALSLRFAFPHGELTRQALLDARRRDAGNTSAQYLLGMMALQRGEVREAIAAWDSVKVVRRDIPGLARNLGYALLLIGDTARARAAFSDGVTDEPTNPEVWVGLDSLMVITGSGARERAVSFDRYPDRRTMPTALAYRYARLLAASGRFDDAEHVFFGRFFSRVEGGTNPRGVWVEVRSARALASARGGRCRDALAVLNALGAFVPGLAFTHDGMAPFISRENAHDARAQVEATCTTNRR